MIRGRQSIQEWWSEVFDRFAHSYLVWAMVAVIIGFWLFNLNEVVSEYAEREDELLKSEQALVLERKREQLEDVFRSIHESTRTLSLIPAIRSVTGGNRLSADDDPVNLGRLSVDIHQTVQQIYYNLSRNVQISEIYYVLDGFRPELGEVPFFMYDDLIARSDPLGSLGYVPTPDTPLEDEGEEYAYYLSQLDWFRKRYPQWVFENNIDGIPAILSPALRTCDVTQYESVAHGNPADAAGILYSVPVYALSTGRLKGLMSAVLRTNVLEAVLIGVPQLVITDKDRREAERLGFSMPATPASFALQHVDYDIEIFDRRNPVFAEGIGRARERGVEGRWGAVDVRMRVDGTMSLHHYLSPAEIDRLAGPLREERKRAVAARLILLLLLMLVFWRAIRDQRHHHQELVRLALYDTLTALPNRRLFLQRLEQSLARAHRHETEMGLMVLDIDNFGSINDTVGHEGGDALLAAVAARLRRTLRISDEVTLRGPAEQGTTLARLGSDDFTLIFEDLISPEDAGVVAERIMDAFREPLDLGEQEVEVSLSAGLAVFPYDADSGNGLMVCAEQALRAASATGAGQYRMFNDEMRQRAERQNALMRELPNAVREKQFALVYQPKLDLKTERVVSFEALLRWHSPVLGMVSPLEFVPLLERSGQIVEVGRWILETACAQLLQWQRDGRPDMRVSVNVSARQLLLSDVVSTVREVLHASGLKPHTLTLEITESMVIDNMQDGRSTLERLRGLGAKLAIDDFGTGYSSLTYLQNLPVDCLKLDKTMIDTILQPKGAHVVRSTIGLAHGLGLELVAEGVEEEAQMSALAGMDCDMMQGYFLSRPMPPEEASEFLLRRDGVCA